MRRFMMMTIAAGLVVACDSATGPGAFPAWTGDLEGVEGYEDVAGAVEVKSKGVSFTAAIEIEVAAEGEYHWEVAAGTCEEPGDRVGAAAAYGQLEVGEEGTASRSVTVGAVVSGNSTYHAAVFHLVDDERVEIACGDLERSN